ncbi:MAG: DNA ligase D [Bdellovibrionota bacterium]
MRPLEEYNRKRDFKKTPEPGPIVKKTKSKELSFVIQEHHASHLHYDFRLEMEGVLRSWAVPKGVPMESGQKKLAMEVEDHPIPYGKFEGMIPKNEYGGGIVYIWDAGTWSCEGDPVTSYKKGRIEFTLKGKTLRGRWMLVRTRNSGSKPQWLLIKRSGDTGLQPGAFATFAEGLGRPSQTRATVAGKAQLAKDVKAGLISSVESKALSMSLDKSAKARKKVSPVSKNSKQASSKSTKSKSVKKKSFENELKTRKGPMTFVDPQLARLVDAPPVGPDWIHETKFDGYRIQVHIKKGKVMLCTRRGLDWSHKYPTIAKAFAKVKADVIIDGEVVALDQEGRSDFQNLQNSMSSGRTGDIVFYGFDLLYLNGEDLRELPLIERKAKLQKLIKSARQNLLRFSEHFEVEGHSFLKAACSFKLEGIISKRVDSPYVSGRQDFWVKSKCTMRQEFVIGGYTDPQGARKDFGALLLGVYEDGRLRYVGRCGTGFNVDSLKEMKKRLRAIAQDESPFQIGKPPGRGLHWVKPKLVAEVAFSNWTTDKILRVPVFQGLREDKPASQIIMEKPVPSKKIDMENDVIKQQRVSSKINESKKNPSAKTSAAGSRKKHQPDKSLEVTITHPDRIIYKKEKLSKGDVAHYYEAVGKWILPHISDRPLSLVRCPDGMAGECFFQKHSGMRLPDNVETVMIKEKTATREYMVVDSTPGILSLIQNGTLELHTWNTRKTHLKNPDQFIMDFDPSPGISWETIIQSAFDLKEILDQLKLKSWVKLSGGKGIHVQVPIAPIYTWKQVKDFSHAIAQQMRAQNPKLYTDQLLKTQRKGKIFVDYLRNGESATAVVPYSLRARENSAVAMPVEWDELRDMPAANHFTLEKAIEHLQSRKKDPWKDYFKYEQKISVLDKPGKH